MTPTPKSPTILTVRSGHAVTDDRTVKIVGGTAKIVGTTPGGGR